MPLVASGAGGRGFESRHPDQKCRSRAAWPASLIVPGPPPGPLPRLGRAPGPGGWPPRGAPGRSPNHAASRPVRTGITMRPAPSMPACPSRRLGRTPPARVLAAPGIGISDGRLSAPLAQPVPARHDRPGSRGGRASAATSPPGPGCGRTSHISDGGPMGRVLHKATIVVCQNENLSCVGMWACSSSAVHPYFGLRRRNRPRHRRSPRHPRSNLRGAAVRGGLQCLVAGGERNAQGEQQPLHRAGKQRLDTLRPLRPR